MSDDGWFVKDLVGCARCNGDGHPQLVFKAFQIPSVIDVFTMTHWATCPETGEPILYGTTGEKK